MKTYTLPSQHRTGRRVPRITGPLSNEQKARICILAKDAYALQFTDEKLEDWRRNQQFICTGKASLVDCVQADYLPLCGHFQRLGGEEGDATRTENHALTEDHRVAMHKLRSECAARGLAMAYPAAICRRQHRCELEQATPRQVWCLVFTVRNRRSAGKAERLKS